MFACRFTKEEHNMTLPLNEEQKKNITVTELARLIFRLGKESKVGISDLPILLKKFAPENEEQQDINNHPNKDFSLKFYEAIASLKRRGLLMDVIKIVSVWPPGTITDVRPTSIWGKSFLDEDGIIILIDDAQEIVNSLKKEILNLDPVVEQYYLESLRACQEGLYISSVICLGAASKRAIDCLKEAIVRYDSTHNKLKNKRISESIKYILDNITLFDPVVELQLRNDLKEQLDLVEKIFRLNRNEAGHPRTISMSITRCEQENYLNSFRRYVTTIFKVISKLI
jgi:hypothetical protein